MRTCISPVHEIVYELLGPRFCTQEMKDFKTSTEIREMDGQVEHYVEKQRSPQKEIVRRLRKIILKTFRGIKEEMKMGVP
jgi:hypothetical protein